MFAVDPFLSVSGNTPAGNSIFPSPAQNSRFAPPNITLAAHYGSQCFIIFQTKSVSTSKAPEPAGRISRAKHKRFRRIE